jgi:hypothetical protein
LLIRLFVLLLFKFVSSMYVLDINPLSNKQLAKILSHSVGCLLILVIVSFDMKEFLKII